MEWADERSVWAAREHVFVGDLAHEIRELAAAGVCPAHIAHRLQVAHATVGYHLKRATEGAPVDGVTPTRRGRRVANGVPTRTLVAGLLDRGLTRTEIARRLGIAKSTVTYHAKRLGLEVDERFAQRFDWPLVQRHYDEGHSVRDCCRAFGFSSWTWHQAVQRGAVVPRPSFKPIEEIFAVGTRRGRGHLKRRLLQAGLKEDRCERCGIDSWLGAPLSISLHHINGVRDDNRLGNLQLLCPNCHSQTDTFAGRNGRSSVETADIAADGGADLAFEDGADEI